MLKQQLIPLRILVAFTLTGGLIYPFVTTVVAQAAFPWEANGSVLEANGKRVGSALIGQSFEDARYFWGRPSATAERPYNARASGGSNLGPLNPGLRDSVAHRKATLTSSLSASNDHVPVDLVTSSASGLDPHISIASAKFQISRVARARGMPESEVLEIVKRTASPRVLGFLGEPTVSVLELNLALDGRTIRKAH